MADTISARITNGVIKFMADGNERNITEIKELLYLEEGLEQGKDYHDPHLAGVLGRLKRLGFLESAGRGIYRATKSESGHEKRTEETIKAENAEPSTGILVKEKQRIIKEFEAYYFQLTETIDNISVGTLAQLSLEDLSDMRRLLELKDDIRKILEKYRKI